MKTVFFDIDTQIDFVYPAGALYAKGAEKIIHNVSRLNHQAATVISTVDAHTEDDLEFRSWPPHCVVDTVGQQKPASTLTHDRVVIPNRKAELHTPQQIILQKQHTDCFTNPNLPALLELLAADHYVVYGVVTEVCVRQAVEGLLKTGKRVEIVTDAIAALHQANGEKVLSELVAAGAHLTTTAAIL